MNEDRTPDESQEPESEELSGEELEDVQGGAKVQKDPDSLLAHELTNLRKKDGPPA